MAKRRPDPAWTPFERAVLPNVPTARVCPPDQVWMNSVYQVSIYRIGADMGTVEHLSIKRRDRKIIRDWRHLQRIKNELCGPEREGVEIFPAESRLVDTSNQYHLFVLPEGVSLGLGFNGRMVSEDPGNCGAVQRKFDDDCRPDDLVTAEEMDRRVQEAVEKL